MALSDDILSDLDDMMSDWGDSITIGGTTYAGLYDSEYVELVDVQGYKPVFTAKTSDVSGVARETAVTVTSPIADITDKAFKVAMLNDLRDGTTKLLLKE